MMSSFLRSYSYFLSIALLFLISGCIHGGFQRQLPDPVVTDLITGIRTSNSELKTFKGIGSVRLNNDGQQSSFRLAWAGEGPDKLRLIVLMSGSPIETFAADGKNIYLKSHTGGHRFIKKKSSNESLEKLISIPVKTEEIIQLLSGKIPLADYTYSRLIKSPDSDLSIIELSKPFWGVVERIFVNDDKTIAGFEMVNWSGPVYRVSLSHSKNINGFILPFEMLIESDDAACKINYSNYFTNPDVEQAIFSLKPD